MEELFQKPVFVFEIVNNHQGSVSHSKRTINTISQAIKEFRKYFDFAFKFQYKHFDTFMHSGYKNNFSYKYIKRFSAIRFNK